MIDYWTRSADNLIIGKYYDTHSLGLYNRGYKLLQMSTGIITGIFGTVLFPSLKNAKIADQTFRFVKRQLYLIKCIKGETEFCFFIKHNAFKQI
ncbi:hypothetical protein ES708_11270 [subsurface metagenome]